MSYRTGNDTVCIRVRASFSPEILQAAAVKELIIVIISLSHVTGLHHCTTSHYHIFVRCYRTAPLLSPVTSVTRLTRLHNFRVYYVNVAPSDTLLGLTECGIVAIH